MDREEFCRRFIDYMVKNAGFETFECGTRVADYALETAPTYYDDPFQRRDGPEHCAEADMSYWGEE